MRIFTPLLIFLVLPFFVFTQNVTGRILDAAKSPIVGAYVIHMESEHHAHTNEFGKFFLNEVKVGDTLQVLHLGYQTLLYPVTDISKEIIIEMEEAIFELGEILVGQNIKKVNLISSIDVRTTPVNSSQEILRKVPGLFIGQHAGGGKAEQIFLRGFDIDHGTDVQISVDGMPVNMVSHAHGQGYADLHFLIPETIEQIDFGKGPYYGEKGNFATAGYVQFVTKERLENSQLSIEAGRFNFLRATGLFKLLDTERHHIYLATENMINDGPFESSQDFSRNNFMLKYSGRLSNQDRISVLASHFTSKWDASGQVPQRAVDQGLITRFGAIDDTEGGHTSRTNFAISFNRSVNDRTFIKNNFYYSHYDFELFSNFTFFLNDSINGDQIRQKEDRNILGFESVWNHVTDVGNSNNLIQLGIGMRSDEVNGNELSRTRNRRTTLEQIQLGDVDEKNLYAFSTVEFDVGDWLFQPSVRFDYFKFDYINNLDTVFNRKVQTKGAVSPKFSIIYNLNPSVQLFLKTGVGFHSNDTRVILEQDNTAILPPAYGADLGAILKPAKRLIANVALWYLFLEQEFVYVGDEGVVEPSGRTQRTGVDAGFRYQANDWFFVNGDINYSHARSVDEPEAANFIPLAPDLTATGGLTFRRKNITSSLQFRYLKDRPANEDNSIVANGYFITDFNASYTIKSLSFGFSIDNLFNQEWKETQFATESRLRDEATSVEEIHFTPGTPFFIKGIVKYKF